jgi:hypothetical protein
LLHVVNVRQNAPRPKVVRISSCTPSRDSICARRLLMAGVVTFSSRAVAEKLPSLASRLKKDISDGAVMGVDMC